MHRTVRVRCGSCMSRDVHLADGEGRALKRLPAHRSDRDDAVQPVGRQAEMSIGLGAAVGLWVISGVAFWSAFAALGFRFRPADEADGASAPTLDERHRSSRSGRSAPDHVLARSRR